MSKRILIYALLLLPSYIVHQSFLHAETPATVRIDKTITIFNDVMRELDMNYVDTLNYEDLTESAINHLLRKIDPYTVYYPKEKDPELKMMTTGKYGGIGSIISQRDSLTYVNTPYENMPAQRNDVQAGDRILSVDGISTEGKTVSEVSNLLRGVPGTKVRLVLEREGLKEPIVREFEREEIHLPAVAYSTVLSSKVGYLAFSEFTTGSSQEFAAALEDLVYNQGAKALIVDLRGNGGGLVDEAIKIVNLFVGPNIEIVTTKGKIEASNRSYKTTMSARYPELPLRILVDKNSASASEIVAGSLQDLKRATLIGQRTYGKGLVQNLRPIAYDGHLKVTTSKYYLPSGRCIQAIDYAERQKGKALKRDTAGGILPDIVIEDSAKVDITYALYSKHMFFDYATRYKHTHDTIAADFQLAEADIEDFCAFLEERKFTYETETAKMLKDVLEMARNEDIDSSMLAQLSDIETQLSTINYREAINRNLDEVKEFLGADIVERYSFQKGRAAYLLRFDKELKRAIESLE